ncbi:hypothetical protein RRG08_041114 [Elysia crispata]|uniref:Uncharacterized protein n=1 Tax=Elysia crispata TaxID=231223 RepID=A0AAE0XXM1_9GAST|nr:hypothetical protein RRG08_041114 [Elysia crispata]
MHHIVTPSCNEGVTIAETPNRLYHSPNMGQKDEDNACQPFTRVSHLLSMSENCSIDEPEVDPHPQ